MKYKPAWYESPINLPEGRSGDVEVSHRILNPGDEVTIVGMRQAILRGIRPVGAKVQKQTRVHQLVHDQRGMWMTDLPEELNQIAELLWTVQPRGNVLVGGLGLGILAKSLTQRPDVDRVVVVEIDRNVIKLCQTKGYEVEADDVNHYLRTSAELFDYYLLDTWQATNESAWWREVMPMRRIIRQKWGKAPVIHCWAEDIMLGQIMRSLTTKPQHWHYEGLPMPMSERDAKAFVRDVGLPAWERRYGAVVDANMKREVA